MLDYQGVFLCMFLCNKNLRDIDPIRLVSGKVGVGRLYIFLWGYTTVVFFSRADTFSFRGEKVVS